MRDIYIYQHVKDYTRYHNAPSVLDLILSNEENISEIQFLPSLGKSDHLAILFDFNCFIEPEPDKTFKKLNFFKGDYKSITSELSRIDWSSEISDLNLNLSWSFLVDIIVKLTEKYISENKVSVDRVGNNPYMSHLVTKPTK